MDWNSRRITAILENALLEDRATRDATSYACIDPNQRATATDSRQAGLHSRRHRLHRPHSRCLCRARRRGHLALRGHQPSRNFRWRAPAQGTVGRGHPPQRARDSFLRARDPEFSAAHERHRHPDAQVRGSGRRHQGPHSRYAQDRARPARASTSTRCAAAAGRITASIFPTAC